MPIVRERIFLCGRIRFPRGVEEKGELTWEMTTRKRGEECVLISISTLYIY